MKKLLSLALAASLITAPAVMAEQISFNNSWKEQKFSLFSKNKYSFGGGTLGIQSDASVSMTYLRLPENAWSSTKASWRWRVDQSVPATDLHKKGGDDRNFSFYMIFMSKDEALQFKGKSLRRLFKAKTARILVYTWGGAHGRGKVFDSPYSSGVGKTVILRDAGTGNHRESVDFVSDYKRAFGGTPGAVVGFAITADSDDTDTAIRAQMSNLVLN